MAYLAISSTLAYLVWRIRDLPLRRLYVAFGIVIIAGGMTHFFSVWTLWHPDYWLDGIVKAITAVASVGTALLMASLVPKALAMVQGARLAEERATALATAYEALGTLHERMRQVDANRTQFFANVSHELRTPLALILGHVDRLAARPDALTATEARQDLAVVQRNAHSLLKHVNDLLEVAKLEAGQTAISVATTDLSGLLHRLGSYFDGIAGERQVDLQITAPDRLLAVVDSGRIERILLNLLSNAFKFTPAGGRIACTLHQVEASAGRQAVLTVADSGPGIPAAQRDAVFERFFQVADSSTRVHAGTGLGLAIVQDLVTLHGGTITVAEADLGGALFVVTLPVGAPDAAAGPAAAGLPAALVRQTVADLQPVFIEVGPGLAELMADRPLALVVEDNREMNRFIAETLAADFRTESAFDGAEGLAKALALHPDVIITDVMMPAMSGAQLTRQVRRHPELAAVPIIVLTAKADDTLRLELLAEGAQDYLLKPFAADEVRLRVGNLVSMKRTRDLLQGVVSSQQQDLATLAGEIVRRNRDLQAACESLEVARDRAEQATRVRGTFLSLVSHELRSPLTALCLHMQRLVRETAELSPRHQLIVPKMLSAADRLQQMIESLLEYTRIESGKLITHPEPVDLRAVAGEVIGELRAQADFRQLTLVLTDGPPLPALYTDPRLVRLILANLVDNALKYTDAGTVVVTLSEGPASQRITVADPGRGIPADQLQRIFEPFEQVETVRRKHTPGFGLGLSLVREVIVILGGRIHVEPTEGRGSVFTVSLPDMAGSPET
ncbi:MAG: response regulator [Candidatus Sericytochromatia bacterium]|nr:response regulator [Candidatus Sericytochromatia bacterium]